jgi:hypothetical protein
VQYSETMQWSSVDQPLYISLELLQSPFQFSSSVRADVGSDKGLSPVVTSPLGLLICQRRLEGKSVIGRGWNDSSTIPHPLPSITLLCIVLGRIHTEADQTIRTGAVNIYKCLIQLCKLQPDTISLVLFCLEHDDLLTIICQ